MADWSQLPTDLLLLTAKRLNTCSDVTRFRSVFSSWRSSVPPEPRCVPANCPLPQGKFSFIDSFCLSTRTIFLIRLPENHNQWLVKTEEDEHERMHLLNPLSNSEFVALPNNFPKVLDLSNFQVIELGFEYVVLYSIDLPQEMEAEYERYSKKVAFLWLSSGSDDFVLLAVHYSGNLAIYRSRDKQCTALENTPEWCIDFISFNGKFYALDQRGRTLVVEPSSKMSVLPHVGSLTRRKFLVESGDELLLVDMFLIISQERDTGFLAESTTQLGWCGPEQIVWSKVYKLDEEGQKWDDVQSLGNRVLFLGENCSFSASASEFSWGEGNCIIFKEKLLSLRKSYSV